MRILSLEGQFVLCKVLTKVLTSITMFVHCLLTDSVKVGKLLSTSTVCFRLVGKWKHRRFHRSVFVDNAKANKNTITFCGSLNMWTTNTAVNTLPLSCLPLLKRPHTPDKVPLKGLPHLEKVNHEKGLLLRIGWLIWDTVHTFLRFAQLSCIFLPLVIVYPLTFCSHTLKSVWYQCFLLGVEFSGPIIIKLGQWASTRKDLFSEEFCSYLSKLQRRTRPHSWYYTEKSLENAFGPSWQDIFVEIDNNGCPIGSGCCAQVYKAWVKKDVASSYVPPVHSSSRNLFKFEVLDMLGLGRFFGKYKKLVETNHEEDHLLPVAVKVLHPRMEVRLRQDLFILKACASTITWLIPSLQWLSLRECMDEFSQSMKSQVDFFFEARNLELFAKNFRNLNSVKFPQPVWPLTTSCILVETFEEGEPIENFMKPQESASVKKQLADVGVNALLKMVFQDNFIHGDLHPGNMLVRFHPHEVPLDHRIKFPFWRSEKLLPFSLVIFDCGIVSSLDARGKKCLRDVFTAVAKVDGERVAELFLEHSNHRCTDVEGFKKEMKEIVSSAMSKSVTLQQVDVSQLMKTLFSTMISHKVKVDSTFSSVILAIMVVEGLGRSLDPTIDVVEKAKPFLFR